MRRKGTLALLALSLCLLFPGCAGETGETYGVYFQTQEVSGTEALTAEPHTIAPDQEPVEALLALLVAGPTQEDLSRTIPSGTTVRSWSQENGVVTVDFSSRYGSLSGVGLTLADYSVVLTLTQVEGVEGVVITADGKALPYRDHQLLTAADTALPQDTATGSADQPEQEEAP